MMGANKNPKPLAGAAGEGFSKIWVVLGRFPVCEDFFCYIRLEGESIKHNKDLFLTWTE